MKPISDYNDNLGTAIALTGGAGAGKTSMALRLFKRTWVGVADPNFRSGLSYLQKLGLSDNIVGYDNLLLDDNDKPLPANQRYDRLVKKMKEVIADPNIDCGVIDSGTFVEEIFKAKICNAPTDAQIKLNGFEQWGSLLITWKWFIMEWRMSGKKFIMPFHEQKEKDESDQVFKYQIAVDGQIRHKIPAMFSDVLRCEVAEGAIGKPPVWNVRTIANIRQEHLKNTFGLPQVLTQDEAVKTIQETLYGPKKA